MREIAWQILALTMASPVLVRADTAVAIWTGAQVTVAADSRRAITRNGKIFDTETTCKLRSVGDLVIATSGLVGHEEDDLLAAIRDGSANNGDSISAATLGPVESVRTYLERIMTLRERFSGTHLYESVLNVSALIAGLSPDGKPLLGRIHVLPGPPESQVDGSSTDFTFSVASYPGAREGHGSDPKRAIEIIGVTNAISRFKARSPKWDAGPDVEVGMRLVDLEARDPASSPYVGGSVSSLRIDRTGIHWIQKGVCRWEPSK